MSKLYKLINSKLATPPTTGTKKNGETVSGYNRLPIETLAAEGWKPLTVEQSPDTEDKQYEYYYQETDSEILQKWREVEDVGTETEN